MEMKNSLKKLFSFSKIKLIILFLFIIVLFTILMPSLARISNRVSINGLNTWDGSVATSFKSGNGTQNDPFIISNGDELAYLSTLLDSNFYQNAFYELSNDIILNNGNFSYENNMVNYNVNNTNYLISENSNIYEDGVINVLNSINNFKGNFNGNYHTIYGLYLSNNYEKNGLFTNLYGTVSNLYITNAFVYGGLQEGILASNTTNATINNVVVNGNVISDVENYHVTHDYIVDDISEKLDNEEITKLIDISNINYDLSNIESIVLTGNLINESNCNVLINNQVISNGEFSLSLNNLNELSLYLTSNTKAEISITNLTITITSNASIAGGLIGSSVNTALNNVINKANVFADNIAGGLIGYSTNNLIINNSYNHGNINTNNIAGGLVGNINNSMSVINKVYNISNVLSLTSGDLIGLINNSEVNINNSLSSSKAELVIGSTQNSNINVINSYYMNPSINTNGFNYTETIDKNLFLNTLLFSEFVDKNEIINDKIWVYDNYFPILYFDDINNPVGELHINNYSWNNLGYDLTSLKYKNDITFAVDIVDNTKNISNIYYYLKPGDTPLNKSEIDNIAIWENYNNSVNISDEGIYIIYIKIVDENNIVYYINSDVLILDKTASEVSINLKNVTWSEVITNPSYYYIDDSYNISINATDTLSGIKEVLYFISDTYVDYNIITEWSLYTDSIKFNSPGSYIIYTKIIDNCDYITYANTDYIVYGGYNYSDLKAGISGNITSIINITPNSSVSFNTSLISDLNYINPTHSIISNTLLPENTLITIIDKTNGKIYEYTTDSSDYNFSNNQYASYNLNLFKEIGKSTSELFIEPSNLIDENYKIIVDFKNATIQRNYENIKIYLSLNNNDNIIKPLEKDIKEFNIYINSSPSVNLNSTFRSQIVLNSNSESIIDLNTVISNLKVNDNEVVDSNYQTKKVGLKIQVVDANDVIIDRNKFKNMTFKVNDIEYTFNKNNTLFINLEDNYSSELIVNTSLDNILLEDDTYYLKINNFISEDGYTYENLGSNTKLIPVVVTGSQMFDYNFNILMDDSKRIISKNNQIENIDFELVNDLNNSVVYVSLYKMNDLKNNNKLYSLIDLNLYTTDNLILNSDFKYNFTNNINLDLNTLDIGAYKFEFQLYKDNQFITSIDKKFIIKRGN